jgi:hypothetical protein
MDKVIGLCVNFLLAQANGWACVDFGCSHSIVQSMGCFEIYSSIRWVSSQNMRI